MTTPYAPDTARTPSPDEPLLAGRYRVQERIGVGGVGEVYKAWDDRLHRLVAIKILRPEFMHDAQARDRFASEARAAAQLHHPNIVAVYDFGPAPDGSLYIAMQYVDGCTLKDTIRERGRIPPAEAAHIGRQLAGALAAARSALLAGRSTIGEVAADLDAVLRTDKLLALSRWVTPPFVPRRFDVRFFVAELPPDTEPSFEGGEVVESRWMTPRAALDAMAAGEISLWVPTSTTLQQLEHVPSVGALREAVLPGAAAPIGLEEVVPGVVRVALSGAGGISGHGVNAWLVGRREIVVVDPGDPSEAAADAILALADARGARVVGIALTHAAPDHAAGVEGIAVRLGVPVFGGPGSGRDLSTRVEELRDGDPLPVGDEPVVALATPGPRADHTAWVLADAGAILVGDLVGPGPPESLVGPPDTDAWRASLDRVESLGPRRLLPGHGALPSDPTAAVTAQRLRLDAG